jgi:hypothetical protein
MKKLPEVIGITVGDNDFCSTLQGFLELLRDQILDRYSWQENKYCPVITTEFIRELWYKTCVGIYYMYQNQLNYTDNEQHIKDYLACEAFKVYFDEEAIEQFYGDHNSSRKFLWVNHRDIKSSIVSGEGDYTLPKEERKCLKSQSG